MLVSINNWIEKCTV